MVIAEPQPVPLSTTEEGQILIRGTRVPLATVVRAFHQGATPEEITQDFPALTLPQVYATISYYLWNREEVDAHLREWSAHTDQIRHDHESRFDPTGIRARLLARIISK